MPRVDFYVLGEGQSAEQFICRLAGKLYQQKQALFIYCHSSEQAKHLDQLLWTFNDIAFIPHADASQAQADTPIVLGYGEHTPEAQQVVLNLSAEVPGFVLECERVLELVAGDQQQRGQARQHYRFYQQQQCQLESHTIS